MLLEFMVAAELIDGPNEASQNELAMQVLNSQSEFYYEEVYEPPKETQQEKSPEEKEGGKNDGGNHVSRSSHSSGDSSVHSSNSDRQNGGGNSKASKERGETQEKSKETPPEKDKKERKAEKTSNPSPEKTQTRTQKTFEVTAYTANAESTGKNPGDAGHGVTASGKHVQPGVTAACPPSMDFGTQIYIEGVGNRVCYDRGADIGPGRIDVYMTNLNAAQNFGRKNLNVTISK